MVKKLLWNTGSIALGSIVASPAYRPAGNPFITSFAYQLASKHYPVYLRIQQMRKARKRRRYRGRAIKKIKMYLMGG